MGQMVDLGGSRAWYDVRGDGEPLVLLHGGMVGANAFDALAPHLTDHFRIYLPERTGHGHTPDRDGPITFELMTDETIAFIERVGGGPVHLAGHSDGGILTLLVALKRPDLVRRIVPISANIHHDAVLGLNDMTVEDVSGWLSESYAATSPDGIGHLPEFAGKVLHMWRTEPTMAAADLAPIRARTLVMAADDDAAALAHTIAIYEAIGDSELAVVPGTSHALIDEKPALVARLMLDFLLNDPVPTFIPIRRARGNTA